MFSEVFHAEVVQVWSIGVVARMCVKMTWIERKRLVLTSCQVISLQRTGDPGN